jgi:hypothetical protein
MPDRISESQLILPALLCISEAGPAGLTTGKLIKRLRELLNPTGEDLEILDDRSDDKFSQKVRNLKSHNTLSGFATNNSGVWQLTDQGRAYLGPFLDYLQEAKFDYPDIQDALRSLPDRQATPQDIIVFDEGLLDETIEIREGATAFAEQKTHTRSAKLRDAAFKKYSKDGTIACLACGFDFGEFYGPLGKAFMEIHHIKPIFSYGEAGLTQTIKEALDNVVPLCSNCHRMIHRKRGQMLSLDQLRQIISGQKP